MNNIVLDKENYKYSNEIILNELEESVLNIEDNLKVIININEKKFDICEFNLGNNAYLIINKMYNEEEVEEEVNINLNGLNSKVDYNFSTSVDKNQRFIININHNNKNTESNVVNHGVVKNDSKLEFVVNSIVKKGNKKSILNQESKIIVMGENNSVIKPNLLIDEFDVNAFHSATIGKFNKDEIFYLMTKGISKKNAINLLMKGFLEGHIGR